MIYIAIPSITPRLAACAVEAIARTTPEPHRVAVVTGRTHGEALDYAVANLPSEATHLFTMDDDAAPLKIGWLTWLRHRMTCTETECTSFGTNSAVGALYSASALRRVTRRFADSCNPGDAVRGALRSNKYLSRSWSSRWWLRNCEVYRDDEDDLVFAHLGGGTIGQISPKS